MKLLWLAGILAFGSLGTQACAHSAATEIPPGQKGFTVTSKRLPNGDVQFTVEVSANSFSPKGSGTSLSTVNIDHRPNGQSISARQVRSLEGKLIGDAIKFVFSVSKKELDDPDLSFCLATVDSQFGGFVIQFARLQKFLKP